MITIGESLTETGRPEPLQPGPSRTRGGVSGVRTKMKGLNAFLDSRYMSLQGFSHPVPMFRPIRARIDRDKALRCTIFATLPVARTPDAIRADALLANHRSCFDTRSNGRPEERGVNHCSSSFDAAYPRLTFPGRDW